MGKVKLLLDVIGDLRSLADSLQAVADAVEAEMTATKGLEKAGKTRKAAWVPGSLRQPQADHPGRV